MNAKSDRIKNWPKGERPRERLVAEGPERLKDAELLSITRISKHRRITTREYSDLCKVSVRQALDDLLDLLNAGVVVRIGKGRGTSYGLRGAGLVRD